MELCTHHIMVVTGENANASARLPVPDSDGLIVRCAENPWIFVVKEGSTDVVEMAKQGENAPLLLIVPDLTKLIKFIIL